MKKATPLQEGIDFKFDHNGNMVFTRLFLLKRGYCCQSGCKNCPWDYKERFDPSYPMELQLNNDQNDYGEESD